MEDIVTTTCEPFESLSPTIQTNPKKIIRNKEITKVEGGMCPLTLMYLHQYQ
jgi:hypothetical protein